MLENNVSVSAAQATRISAVSFVFQRARHGQISRCRYPSAQTECPGLHQLAEDEEQRLR